MRCVSSLSSATQRGHGGRRKAQRIGTVFVDQVKRIDHIAGGFRHLLALGVAHKAVQIDGFEGFLFDHRILHHHHACDPEEEDVLTCDQVRCGKVFCHFGRGIGPAERADRPEARGEPGVEHVGVA